MSDDAVGPGGEPHEAPASGPDVEVAARALQEAFPSVPGMAVVIGSGLGSLEDALTHRISVPFASVPGLPGAGVSGHRGRFSWGRLEGREVLVQSGRFHVYEGHPLETVVAPVRILAALGVERLILTNAAGGIHPLREPGDLVLLDDVLNLMFRSPLAGPVVGSEARFPDMSRPLDPALRRVVRSVARELEIELEEGVYAAVTGPSYETRAEIRMLARLGADLVGMSTVPEVVAATAVGLPCAALSLVTNKATGLGDEALSHDEVLETGRVAGEKVRRLVTAVVSRLDEAPPEVTGSSSPLQSGEAK
ncbi:MAG: purine-nucleoside phosphorylase [Longimicrobiales bacterium]|nr:purine-nucleoside phosphorylase [Longimicrobiales bacterium]